jgi:hypothetical protein
MIIFATVLSPAMAQTPGPPPGGGDKSLGDVLPGVKGRSNEMERVKRDAEKPEKKSNAPEKKSNAEETFTQIKEDFEQIQLVNSNVLQAAPAGVAPDYGHVSEAAAEIKKRAARLKTNLFGAESEKQPKQKEEKGEKAQPDLKSLLSALDVAVSDFTHSPIFQNTKVVNPEDSTKARSSLEEIIKLSTRIWKETERLKKESGG